ncbi:hypothetical protein Droror1_Dr00010412 [Drosera rotundifolia]
MRSSTDRKMVPSGGSPARYVNHRRMLPSSGGDGGKGNCGVGMTDMLTVSLSETVFGFLDHDHGSSTSGDGREGYRGDVFGVEEEEEEKAGNGFVSDEENKVFWEKHHKLLQETICKTSTLERKIRNAAKEALKEAQNEGNYCVCRRPVAPGACRDCLMSEIAKRLRSAGYDCAVCKSKWRSSPDMPSGEHTFLDVMDNNLSSNKRVRVIIELSFKAEFEISRASDEYKQLVARLPEAFVGREERLGSLIKILCSAAKKCMENNKMHIGPWRKQNYMQAKWLGPCKRLEPSIQPMTKGLENQKSVKPKASNSMLTVALLDLLPNIPYKAVTVI